MGQAVVAPAPLLDRPRHAARRRRDRWVDLGLLLPGAGFLALFLVVPLAQVFLRSVGLAVIGEAGRFTWDYYRQFWAEAQYRDGFFFSLWLGVASTVLSLGIALVFSALMQVRFPGRLLISVLYKIPLVVPSLVAAFLILSLIAPGAILARLVFHWGWTWPQLVYDRWGWGIILVLVWHNVPFMMVIISAVMAGIPQDVIDAARNLGAPPWEVFRRVTVPLSMSGISAAALLVFIQVFGAFAVPSLLESAYPLALPVIMQTEMMDHANWALASALGSVLTIASAIVLFLYYRLVAGRGAMVR
ncbi:MAG TPA: ABC transporter permease subunit [bacterium]|nr:ABC transporter permease subunit [bacterium]